MDLRSGLYSASIQGRIATGPNAGKRGFMRSIILYLLGVPIPIILLI